MNQHSPLVVSALIALSSSLVACSGGGSTVDRSDSRSVSNQSNPSATQRTTQRSTQRSTQGSPQDIGRSKRELKAVAVESLLRLSTHQRAEIRVNSLEALQGHTSSLESVVALGLSDDTVAVRTVAAMIAGKQRLRALAPSIENMGNDPSPFVRASALFALDRMKRSGSSGIDLTPLSLMLLDSEDILVSSHAAYVLGELGNSSAIPLLQQAGTRTWAQTAPIRRQLFRLQVAEAMIKLGDQESVHAVRSALYPSRPEELEATALAVQIIGEVQDRGAIDQLIYLVDEETNRPMPAEVRLAVAGALAKLGLREGGFIADEYAQNQNPTIRAQAALVYGRTGQSEHLPKLEALLVDDSPQVQAASAGAILEILKSH